MSKKNRHGKIICRRNDGFGEITITDFNGIRSLSFGTAGVQTRMRLDEPATLVTEYCQAMASALVLGKPQRVLLVGLGGGALVNSLLRICPGASIDAVEISEQVISLAHEYFFIPKDDPKLSIINASGLDFLRRQEACGQSYDLILVDAFDMDGPAFQVLEKEFLLACRERLSENGIFVANLWTGDGEHFPERYAAIRAAFENNTYKLVLGESNGNAVVFAFRNPASRPDLSAHRQEARRLQMSWGIDFPRFFKLIHQQNCS